jgi:hypothetical protein
MLRMTVAATLLVVQSWAAIPTAVAQTAGEQQSINAIRENVDKGVFYYVCEGLIPAYNAATNALDIFGSVNNVGKSGEWLIEKALGTPKNTKNFAGRIPDFVTDAAWLEAKNTKTLSYTKQIRDTEYFAHLNGKTYTIITRAETKISKRLLARAMVSKTLKIIQCLPNLPP